MLLCYEGCIWDLKSGAHFAFSCVCVKCVCEHLKECAPGTYIYAILPHLHSLGLLCSHGDISFLTQSAAFAF